MNEMMTATRREFCKKAAKAVFAGVVGGEFIGYAGDFLDKTVKEVTTHPTGNAGTKRKIEADCKDSGNVGECIKNYKFSTHDKIERIIFNPIVEEFSFRAVPSAILSQGKGSGNTFVDDVFSGTGGLGMKKRELRAGAITSVIFGAAHNFTRTGVDTETIPAAQTFGGMVLWYLQRKFGYAANTFTHALVNLNYYISR